MASQRLGIGILLRCLPSCPLLWTQVIKDRSGFTKTGKAGGSVRELERSGLPPARR
jgi:hypothetical protein